MTTSASDNKVALAVATYELPSGEVTIASVRNIYERLLEPFLIDNDIVLRTGYCRYDGNVNDWQHFQRGKIVWSKLVEAFPVRFELRLYREGNYLTGRDPDVAAITLNVARKPEYASTVELHFWIDNLLAGDLTDQFQSEIVESAKSIYLELSCVNGFIGLDTSFSASSHGCETDFERKVGAPSMPQLSAEFRRWIRGPYWGTLLSKEHLLLLGGENALFEAPVEFAETWSNTSGFSYYLQLTKDMLQLEDEKLKKLEDFMQPILPAAMAKPKI